MRMHEVVLAVVAQDQKRAAKTHTSHAETWTHLNHGRFAIQVECKVPCLRDDVMYLTDVLAGSVRSRKRRYVDLDLTKVS